jgi:hypothetical protein
MTRAIDKLKLYSGNTKAQKRRAKRWALKGAERPAPRSRVVTSPRVPKADLSEDGWNLVLGRRRKGQGRLVPLDNDAETFWQMLTRRFRPREDT